MANKKVSAATDIGTVQSTDVIPIIRPGNTTAYKATLTEIIDGMAATTGAKGSVELATTAEVQAGTDAVRAVTPAGAAATYLKLTGGTITGDVVMEDSLRLGNLSLTDRARTRGLNLVHSQTILNTDPEDVHGAVILGVLVDLGAGATCKQVFGAEIQAQSQETVVGDIDSMIGVGGIVNHRAPGDVVVSHYAAGVQGIVQIEGDGTVVNAYAFLADGAEVVSGAGGVTNAYGLYARDQTIGSAINLSIYSAGHCALASGKGIGFGRTSSIGAPIDILATNGMAVILDRDAGGVEQVFTIYRRQGNNKWGLGASLGTEAAHEFALYDYANGRWGWFVDNLGQFGIGTDTPRAKLDIGAGGIALTEMADPDAPGANSAVLYITDTGGGKTQLRVRFPTGAIQNIATEP